MDISASQLNRCSGTRDAVFQSHSTQVDATIGVRHFLGYRIEGSPLAIVARLKNQSLSNYAPKAAR
jgi:hypothetical protein